MRGKNKERLVAKNLFIQNGLSQIELAAKFKVSPKTMSKWATEGKWKEERDAIMNNVKKRAEDIKQVISHLTERRLAIFREQKEAEQKGDKSIVLDLKREAVAIGQEVAMHTKALVVMDKDNRITLSLYIEIMEDIFKHLQNFDYDLYMKTLDFQETHLSTAIQKLG